jgi:uncharacterized hydrophobic protein (TIGR00271 family)
MNNPDEEQALRPPWLTWLPVLEREDRVKLFDHFETSGSWNADFLVMMGLSTALAALGLLNNAPTAVIGAMLVAPLMSPLLGAGFALIQGNVTLFRSCLKAMMYGAGVSILVSLLIGLMTPEYYPTPQVEARGQVNLLDLGIALVSGMAAAFALARPGLAAILSGVAIAAALVPPLAVVGVAIASREFVIAGFAGVLFITNVVAIILGAAFVFKLVGVQGPLGEAAMPLWARRIKIGLVLATIVLVIPLTQRLTQQMALGQMRPVGYPLSTEVRNAVLDRIESVPGIVMIFMGRYSTAPEAGAQVLLAADVPVPDGFIEKIQGAIRSKMGQGTPVRVIIVQGAHGARLQDAAIIESYR